MNGVYVIGAAMTRFGRHLERSNRDLVEEAVAALVTDSNRPVTAIEAVYSGNAVAGLMDGQESIRAQVALRHTELAGLPMYNVENACASSSTAFHLAVHAVAAGQYETVLVMGFEKLCDAERARSFRALGASTDVAEQKETGNAPSGDHSIFMDHYADVAQKRGLDPELAAIVAVKNHCHGAMNPYAQYRQPVTTEEVLGSRQIAEGLTLLMCSPRSDGAAALLISSIQPPRAARVEVAASVVVSGRSDRNKMSGAVVRAALLAYRRAGIGPEDLDVVEVHDATAYAELMAYEELGFCAREGIEAFVREGKALVTGPTPVNMSGGLMARGHPIGATGAAQLVEIVWQLRGTCGDRQVTSPRIGMTQNAGGLIGDDYAACAIHILRTN